MPKARPKTTRFPDEEILRRVIAAGEQLDKKDGGRLGWLLRFARQDPATWIPEQVALYGVRLLACGLGPLPRNLISFGPDSRLASLTATEVRRFHRDLRVWFRRLVSYPGAGLPGVEVPAGGLRMALVRATKPGVKPAIFGFGRRGPFRTMLFQRAAEWVLATDRLLACPTCGQPFLALRKRLFCSPPCLQEHHDKKKIAARRERKGGGQS